jgi:phosphoribosylglycinamide formyltransferase-1
MSRARIGVLVSGRGRGSNFQALLDARSAGSLRAEVALLIATHAEHGAIEAAAEAKVPSLVLPHSGDEGVVAWEEAAVAALREHEVSGLALAGFLRRVGPTLLQAFPNRVANVHPSLLPAFGGAGMWGTRVHAAVLEHGCKISGCTVHLVDEELDAGPIIAQKCVPVLDGDTPQVLAARVQQAEHELYPACLDALAHGELRLDGRRVFNTQFNHHKATERT